MRRLLGYVMAALAASSSASCIDPVHSDEVAALGPEDEGVRMGPTHRPGQPCLVCHSAPGPGIQFVIAGTIFLSRGGGLPAAGTNVEISDATGKNVLQTVQTNEVGNFYISADQWSPGPTFPLFMRLVDERAEVMGKKEMQTAIGRNGGCAFCHYGDDNQPTHMPPVFLRTQPLPASTRSP